MTLTCALIKRKSQVLETYGGRKHAQLSDVNINFADGIAKANKNRYAVDPEFEEVSVW